MSAKATTPVKSTTPKAKPAHPTFAVMINDAIKKLNEPRTGSTKQSISKFISANYAVDLTSKLQNSQFKKALNKGVETENLKQVKGTGANGSFKIGETAKTAEKLKAKKEKEAAKPKKEVKKVAEKKTKTMKTVSVAKKTKTMKTVSVAKKINKADDKPKKNVRTPVIKVIVKKVDKTTKKAPKTTQSKSPAKKPVAKKPSAKKATA